MLIGIIIGLVIGIPIGIAIISLCVMAKESDAVHEKYLPPDNYCGEEAISTKKEYTPDIPEGRCTFDE